MLAYCTRRLPSTEAMDAAAETFAVAWRRISEVPTGSAERGWLYGVAYRVIANHYRGDRRRRNLASRLKHHPAPSRFEPADQVVRAEDYNHLLACLEQLRPSDRELLLLITWEEHPRPEIAEMLGISRSALDQRVHRATERLRKLYDKKTTGMGSRPDEGARSELH